MNRDFYNNLADVALAQKELDPTLAKEILISDQVEILPLLNAAFEVRKKFRGNTVSVHIINNAQNGKCQEDCHYCAQAKTSDADIEEYPLKSNAEFLAEARNAHQNGAHRYCMVFAGRGPSMARTLKLASLIKQIKEKYPIEICVSAGLLNQEKACILKEAGLDRLNHNLNTSERNYPNICTTHTYQDRLNTLQAAKSAGLEVCSGMIVGMQETYEDIIECAYRLRSINSKSIPVNFFMPITGNKLKELPNLTPQQCLRILALFRFVNPTAEIRAAAGREMHLRRMEVLAFYAADSLFLDGYLNTKGSSRGETLKMLKDAGFVLKSDIDINELINKESLNSVVPQDVGNSLIMKELSDLRPEIKSSSVK